jgi:hypothetical protein
MMVLNAIAAYFLLAILLKLFGLTIILPEFAAHHAWAAEGSRWDVLAAFLPGAAISYGLLWFWLILTGRSERGITWGGALVYGVIIALYNVPLSGFLVGLLHGDPLFGLLIGLVILLLVPSLAMCMLVFGLLMGLLNGKWATRWIERHYAGWNGGRSD